MTEAIKEFIKMHSKLIADNKWEALYDIADEWLDSDQSGELTTTLLGAGIDPFVYMDKIPYQAFCNSSIEEYEVPSNIKTIADGAFYGCEHLKNIIIPNSVTKIGSYAFCYCSSLEEVPLPDNITKLSADLFGDCTSLKKVTIKNNVTKIGAYVFENCQKLRDIYYDGTKKQWNEISKHSEWKFLLCTDCVLHCIDGDLNI